MELLLWPEAWSLGAWYARFPWAIDGLIYLVLFTGLAKVSLGARFAGRGGAAVVAATGTALAFAAAAFSLRTGFTLAQLGPAAWLVLLAVLGLLLFDLLRAARVPVLPAAAVSVLVMLTTAAGLGHALDDALEATGLAPLLQLLSLASLLVLGWWVASSVSSLHARGSVPRRPDPTPRVRTPEQPREAEAIGTVEASVLELLDRLRRHIEHKGVDAKAAHLLAEIRRRDRMVATLHKRLLHEIARYRAKGSQHLPESIRELLVASRDNLSAFERNLEVAEAACRGGDTKLLLSAIGRMIGLEEQAVAITRALVETLRRLRRPTAR